MPLKITIKFILNILCCCVLSGYSFAQVADSATLSNQKKSNNIFNFAKNALSRGADNMLEADTIILKSEIPFLPYESKVIRHIIFEKFGFEKTFQDTATQIKYFGTRLLNALHASTKKSVIRNNLFFKEGSYFDPFLIADNERYLRTLPFIQDARILVITMPENADSVDVIVVTKDIFNYAFDLSQLTGSKFRGAFKDVNFLGQGQRIRFAPLWDNSRNPAMGYDVSYTKTNVSGSFINATVGYSNINKNLADGSRNDHGWYLRAEKPLASASTPFAGSAAFSHSWVVNDFNTTDSQLYKYRYSSYDVWIGHNIKSYRFLRNASSRNRYFVSARYFNTHFFDIPLQTKMPYDWRFNNREGALAQITFFKQNYYKTNYVFSFGTTEDAPFGYNVSVVGGWYKQLNLSRPYIGIDANHNIVSNKGDIFQYFFRAGSFFKNGGFQDVTVLGGASLFSRLYLYKGMKIRQYSNISYTRLVNREILVPLDLNNDFGLYNFRATDLFGDQRITVHSETSFFLKPKLLGFKFSPFVFVHGCLLTPERARFSKSNMYYGLGGGVRTRNENFVLGTIEFRAFYFPRSVPGNETFKISINSNIRLRFNSNYIKAPDIVQANSDYNNEVL